DGDGVGRAVGDVRQRHRRLLDAEAVDRDAKGDAVEGVVGQGRATALLRAGRDRGAATAWAHVALQRGRVPAGSAVEDGVLFDEGQDLEGPGAGLVGRADAGRGGGGAHAGVGQPTLDVVMVVEGQADLFEVVGALHPRGGLADLLHCRQQEADEDGNDGDDYQ